MKELVKIINNSVGTGSSYPFKKPSLLKLPTLNLNLDGGLI